MVTGALAALLVVVSVALAVTLWMLVRRRATPPMGGGEALVAHYQELIDRLPATVAVWNTATMSISFVSSQVEQLTGEPAAMWLGEEGMLRFRSRVHPDDLADPDRWRSNDDPLPSQFRWTRSDGRTIWIRESQSPVSGTDMLGFLSDVTAEVAAAADLAEQRRRYQTLIEQLPVATFLIDADDTLVYVSPQVETILGLSVERALQVGRDSESRQRWWHPDDYDLGVAPVRDMYEGRADGYTFEGRMFHADGSVRHVRVIGRALKDESGTIVASQGVLIDVTDEVNARAERDAHLLRYQTLIEQLPVVTFLIDADGTLLYVSPQIESIAGISVERALEEGRTPEGRRPWFHPDDYDRGLAQAREMYEGRSDGYTFVGREFHADGSERHVRMIVRALKDESGTVVAGQGVTLDVTDEVNARAERDAHLLRYQNLIEQLPVATYIFDPDGRAIYVSPQIEQILGITVEQAMARGQTPESRRPWFHPDDREWTLAKGRDVYEGRSDGYNVAARMIHADGSTRHVRLIARTLKDANGKLIGVQGVLIDTTDEVNARAERDAHLVRFETLVEQTPVVTYAMDERGVLTYVSPQCQRMLGYSPEELVGGMDGRHRQSLIFHPDDREWTFAEAQDIYEGRSDGYNVAARMIHADGSIRHVRMIARTLKDANGELMGVQGILIDTTDEVNARAERDAHLLRYQTLIEQTPVLTYVTDDLGVTTYVSPQCEQLLGYTQDELEGMDELERRSLIFHPDDQSRMAERQEALLAGQVDSADEAVRMVARDGSLRYVQIIARRISGADGAVLGTQGVVVNLTELRAAEQRSNEVLGALVTAAEDERARIATELHDDTVQVMTALLMHVRMLMRTDPGLERFEQQLTAALDRTRRLMFELRPHVLERSGLGAAIDELAVEGPWHEAEVAIDVGRQTDTLEAVAYRALRELIINARKHSKASRLSVRGWQADGQLRFVVEDDGVGFDVARALDRDRMRMHVGLDATGERINLAGGSLDIESSPGAGARIELTLPAQPRANGGSAT